MNSVLKPAGSTKYISEVAEKLKIAVKKQENQVVLSFLNQGDTFRDLQKLPIGDRYYQISMKQRENFLRRFKEANVSVIVTTNIFCIRMWFFISSR